MPTNPKVRFCQVSLFVLTLLAWEGLVRAGLLADFFFSKPSAVLRRVAEWLGTGETYHHLSITLTETFLAFVIGTVLGIGMGLWLALAPTALKILEPYIKAFNAIPRVVLAPIFTLWFGLGILSKVALGVTLVFFLAFFNTYQGVREVNPVVLANARMLGAAKRHLFWHVYLPSTAGWIISSLRAAIGFAMVGAVVGEYLGASAGLGRILAERESLFDTTGVFAGMTILVAVVLSLDWAVTLVERRVLVWRPPAGAAG